MTNVENLEEQSQDISPQELAGFGRWHAEFDADPGERHFEFEAKSGTLNAPAEKVPCADAASQSSEYSFAPTLDAWSQCYKKGVADAET